MYGLSGVEELDMAAQSTLSRKTWSVPHNKCTNFLLWMLGRYKGMVRLAHFTLHV